MTTNTELIANKAVVDDPRFAQGRKCLEEKNYEEAIDFFSSLLQTW
jgi:hypothetical protein